MKNMDKGLTVLNGCQQISRKYHKCPKTTQIVCPSQKAWDFDEKRLHWASVVGSIDCGYWNNWLLVRQMHQNVHNGVKYFRGRIYILMQGVSLN